MMEEETPTKPGFAESFTRKYQYILDKSSPHGLYRWIFFTVSFLGYCLRVYYLDGWFIISYGLGIYLLNQFIGFITPQFDPEDSENMEGGLPVSETDEYRPFARRLPEFKFWHSSVRAVFIALFLTCFDAVNVPVFWPILLLYFLILFVITMKRQIKHMIKYRYVPISWGKQTYAGKGGKDSK